MVIIGKNLYLCKRNNQKIYYYMFTNEDLKQLASKGISQEQVKDQLERFVTGFPYLRLSDSAKLGKSIFGLSTEEEEQAIARWHQYLSDNGKVTKFVPASGAASRMFKALFAFVDGDTDTPKPGSDVDKLLKDIHEIAFFPELEATCKRLYGEGVDTLIAKGESRKVIGAIVKPEGMNYGNLPKGLLTFHSYGDTTRTAIEEQLVEGAQYATSADGTVRLHFTVSTNHRELFAAKLAAVVPAMEKKLGVKYDISMSEQKPSTDTIAVNLDGTPFRENGELLFRPGGHGALIQNLNDIQTPVVFIKNIDNVVPDAHRAPTLRYKKVLAGRLIEIHDRIALYLDMLNTGKYDIEDLRRMIAFLHDELCVRDEKMKHMEDSELALYIKAKLNRPIRVCGMVRNEGEPGGGPYIAYNRDGSSSPQILESTQIDPANEAYKEMVATSSHFNPVDLVCYIDDVEGKKFDLLKYVDPDTGFISSKSLHGKDLKALELPGLWNGAMSDWNTVFVEVPAETFNPVKTVNDLLRPAHR